eukprot:TRINITY_DN11209_c0_g1_i1.p1 TRINITY_DN11209_c0_g1~~TRINITY_DN11209_c0_g1_i1.p1  ORF type:complete len:828 (-),score=158.39 TRINITY_DN11209_c0_g1_i1:123-2606(-)
MYFLYLLFATTALGVDWLKVLPGTGNVGGVDVELDKVPREQFSMVQSPISTDYMSVFGVTEADNTATFRINFYFTNSLDVIPLDTTSIYTSNGISIGKQDVAVLSSINYTLILQLVDNPLFKRLYSACTLNTRSTKENKYWFFGGNSSTGFNPTMFAINFSSTSVAADFVDLKYLGIGQSCVVSTYLTLQQNLPNSYGNMFTFGGFNGTHYLNSLRSFNLGEPGESLSGRTLFDEVTNGSPPSPRAYHSAIQSTNTQRMIIFGGKNGANFYNDLFVFDLSDSSWTQLNPAGDIPSPRAGHMVNIQSLGGHDIMYVHGGETLAGSFLNDLWSFNFTSMVWTQYSLLPTQTSPPNRAYGSSLLTDSTHIAFYGGYNENGHVTSWSVVDLAKECPYHCFGSICTTVEACQKLFDCGAKSSKYQCNLTCVDKPSDCTPVACPSNQYRCPDNLCVDDPMNCRVFPRCEYEEKRCPDGSCIPADSLCVALTSCPNGYTRCPDGRCSPTCDFPYLGCLPGVNSTLCRDGTCRASLEECRAAYNCSTTCENCFEGCREPPGLQYVFPMTITRGSFSQQFLWIRNNSLDPSDRWGLLTANSNTSVQLSVRSIGTNELSDIGPHKSWNANYSSNPLMYPSILVKVDLNADAFGGVVYNASLLLRRQYKYGDVKSNAPALRQTSCFARAVPWYWTKLDTQSYSNLANLPYIKDFIDYYATNSSLDVTTFTGPIPGSNATVPKYRWKCLTSDYNNYPVFITESGLANVVNGTEFLGVYLDKGETSGYFGIITLLPEPQPADPPPTPIDYLSHYILLGVSSSVLGFLIILVSIKAARRRN